MSTLSISSTAYHQDDVGADQPCLSKTNARTAAWDDYPGGATDDEPTDADIYSKPSGAERGLTA